MSCSNIQITPSHMLLQSILEKFKSATQGHSLLKSKSEILAMRFRSLLKDIVKLKLKVNEELKEAAFGFAKAKYAAGEFRDQVIEHVKQPATTIKTAIENTCGVRLKIFSLHFDPNVDVMENIGYISGGQVIMQAREKYIIALKTLTELATLQAAFFTLDSEIKMTNRRVNALDHVVIPRLTEAVSCIKRELHELEREDFFRLKLVQNKKKALAAEEEESLKDSK